MKDIDFDELDRAVSSVLGEKVPSTVADGPSEAANESSSPPTPLTVNKKTKAVPAVTPKPPASLAPKRRGRFMDVMHPTATKPTDSAPQIRKSPVLEPLHSEHAESTETDGPHESVVLQPATKEVEPEKSPEHSESDTLSDAKVDRLSEPTASLDESSSLIGAEPTPMENGPSLLSAPDTSTSPTLNGKNETQAAGDSSEDTVSTKGDPLDGEVPEILAGSSLSDSIPQTSPFLTDTKVDKRPLGGAADGSDASGMGAEPNHTTDETQTAPVVPLPRELQPDVVEVESAQENADETASASPFAANVNAAPDTTDDGRVEGHPLFDTSTYHEPIIAVHDRAIPGWAKWLMGLAACLAVGAGVGYFLFTAGL